MTHDPIVELKNISKKFSSLVALDNISININSGEVLAIIGHNGSGKSTLLKIITGLINPDEGLIYINGESVFFPSIRSAKAVGFELLTQTPSLFPHLSVLENLFIGIEPHYKILFMPIINRKAMYQKAELLHTMAKIERLPITRPVSELSHGQQALVNFMRILNAKPSLLALDEPTAALGYQERKGINNLILELSRQGITILLVSHILDDVMELTDRIAILKKGKIIKCVQTKDVTQNDIIHYFVE